MRTILEIYFGINLFFAGAFFMENDNLSIVKRLIGAIGMALSAIPLFVAAYTIDFLKWIESLIQFRFWIVLWFTNRYNKIDMETLDRLKSSKNNRNWFYRKAVNVLLKRVGGI